MGNGLASVRSPDVIRELLFGPQNFPGLHPGYKKMPLT